ncbi:GNAT family N-acetyltransferase [Dethiothermospora halolimnae]|uniref:GNAT family N-acetyltransferase n=1 Tax=Dethiothermospora halolimnae TaxID=3114390 RepID=UPI003CCC2F6A
MKLLFKEYNIEIPVTLSEVERKDILKLAEISNIYDKIHMEFNLERKENSEVKDLLCYKGKQLIGYLVIYPSYKKGNVKITGTVHPEFRRQGIFSALFKKAKEVCLGDDIHTITLINEQGSKGGTEVAYYLGGELEYSTYKMNFQRELYQKKPKTVDHFSFRKACKEDIDDLVRIGTEGFGTTEEEERSFIKSNLKDTNRNVFVGEIKGKIVGTISARQWSEKMLISDLVVLKSYRGQGIGRKILSKTIDKLLNKGLDKITLVVETQNKNALLLYKDCGFKVDNANDFYKISI